MDEPKPMYDELEQLLERVVFADPDTHHLREQWEQIKAEEHANFERVMREEYEGRVMYHEICKTPNPEVEARREANLLRPMLKEELDARLTERWEVIRRKVAAVLEAKRDGSEG